MFCKYCGKQINDKSDFCPYCGKKLNNHKQLFPKQDEPKAKAHFVINSETVDNEDKDLSAKERRNLIRGVLKSNRRLRVKLIVSVVLILVVVVVGLTMHIYNLADSGDFYAASNFSALFFWDDDFDDYVQSGIKYSNKQYESAYKGFKKLGNYRESVDYYKSSLYLASIKSLEDKDYADAYEGFFELKNYKDSEELLQKVKDNAYDAAKNDFSRGAYNSAKKLFEISGENDSKDYITVIEVRQGDRVLYSLKDMLNFAPAKETLLLNQELAANFLNGSWHSSNRSLYFAMNNEGGTTYNVPWYEYGDYYYIEKGVYYVYKNSDMSDRKIMYEFTVVDWNTIKVKAYQNGNTYTLYRD